MNPFRTSPFRSALVRAIVCVAALALAACGPSKTASSAPHSGLDQLTLVYSCDTSGQIEPCRCTSGQTGGISRRVAWIKSMQSDSTLIVDAGDVAAGGEDWQRFEFETILKGYAEAGYHAVNVGRNELALGRNRLAALRGGPVPFISANVADEAGKLVFDPYRIVEIKGKGRVGIIGIVTPGSDPALRAPGLKIIPADEALKKELPDLRAKSDLVVLLAFATEDEIKTLAGQFDGIDVILGGDTFLPTGEPLLFNKSHVGMITDKGKGLGRMQLAALPAEAGGGWKATNEIVMMKEDLARDADFDKTYEAYKADLAKRDFRPISGLTQGTTTTLPRSAGANHYAGAESCKECHAKAYAVWQASGHAQAFAALEKQNNHYNPRCLVCHTVGYGAGDGYVNPTLTAGLQNVQCEDCHGRGGDHIRAQRGEPVNTALAAMKRVDCTTCHDQENSPGFDHETFWKKIEHGKG